MLFSEILGQDHVKNHLIKSADAGRIPHAQLFIGPEGCGTLAMAIAYARYILCSETHDHLFDDFSHPDLHYIFPTVSEVIKKPSSKEFLVEWRSFLKKNIYASEYDWYRFLGVANKQGEIRKDDAYNLIYSLSLKTFKPDGYRIAIIWMANKMNTTTANTLLKLIEEPLEKTLIILIAENTDDILQTILSRCQFIQFGPLSEKAICNALISRENLDEATARKLAHQAQGNYNLALHLMNGFEDGLPFAEWFVQWVRAAFRAKGNAAAIQDLIAWSEMIAGIGREAQKLFLNYCIDMFRQALMMNYNAKELVFMEPGVDNFSLDKFAPFVNGTNISDIFKELSDALYHIERNGNAKIILTDMSIKLTRLIHKK